MLRDTIDSTNETVIETMYKIIKQRARDEKSNDGNPFDAIIFDLGSTLITFDGVWSDVLARAERALVQDLLDRGIELENPAFLEALHARFQAYYEQRETDLIEHTTIDILTRLLKDWGVEDAPEQLVRQALDAFYAVTQEYWRVEDDTLATLDRLREMNYRLGIISNAGDVRDVQTLVDKAGIREYFDHIIISAALGIRKPHPRIFQYLLDAWNIPSERVAMVGDKLEADIQGAHNAGLYAIWITRRAEQTDFQSSRENQPDAIIEKLNDLVPLLQEL